MEISEIHPPIYSIYFICCLYNYLDIIKEQLNKIIESGLYNETKYFLIFITLFDKNSDLINILNTFDKQNKFFYITTPENLYEKFAINNYKKYIPTSNCYIYYFHTKGITKSNITDNKFTKRRILLDFFILTKYKITLKLLETYHAIGCALLKYPTLHFSGNFWWAKSEHFNKLLNNIADDYLAPEMYICSYPNGNYISLNNDINNDDVDINIFTKLTDEMILNSITNIPIKNTYDIEALNEMGYNNIII